MRQTTKSRTTARRSSARPTRKDEGAATKSTTTRSNQRKRPGAAAVAAAPRPTKKSGGPLTDQQILDLARSVVPRRLHDRGKVVRPEAGPVRAGIVAQRDTAAEVAKLVGAKLPPDREEATVDFEETTSLGKRHTVVHVRDGKVTNVIKRAKRSE